MFASIVRTVVPMVVGVIVGQAARIGLDLDQATVTSIVTVVAGYVYYHAARLLEEHYPAAGRVLLALGLTSATNPTYSRTAVAGEKLPPVR
ncbi:hypothetical protein ACIBI3_02410 [Actinomadura luteofluorescens]|uniref:hypothetical protein n=1 Tax=Actinomadura luteofluorescens TaxID=46163 RepID=UPI003496D0E5